MAKVAACVNYVRYRDLRDSRVIARFTYMAIAGRGRTLAGLALPQRIPDGESTSSVTPSRTAARIGGLRACR